MFKGRALLMALVIVIVGVALATASLRARTQSGPPTFPEKFADGVLYTTVDRPDVKQYRELFAPAAAIDAVKRGRPMPDGTVLTLLLYTAKQDAGGDPVKDANGRFIKDGLIGYSVMEKRPGRTVAPAPELRNGDWAYQTFVADRTVNAKADLRACYQCHMTRSRNDFVFSDDRMREGH